ncbi:hypothetical protein BN2475_1300006 [Paraburkholderia ribeironis]|uniref:Core-binding (CB) domain-containing protein n=1 Tax=Paraburkholderia ribeironis TaxID=1247936 RepID=A0A1N7SPH1_9BURK|nr:hypothetical protein [Paraburkholderia ribeironis]SIT49232.1 hypothetical protein BN2475_1300006 [Paraburkholderia ribeironis]
MSVLPTLPDRERRLTAAQFHQLADVPPEAEWFANLDNPRTRRAYQADLRDFMNFTTISRPEDFRIVTRAHVLAWRKVPCGPHVPGLQQKTCSWLHSLKSRSLHQKPRPFSFRTSRQLIKKEIKKIEFNRLNSQQINLTVHSKTVAP